MNMIKTLSKAIDECPTAYHEFIGKYRRIDKKIYGFVEGKTDPSFYRTYVNTLLPSGWEIDFTLARTKKNVIDVYNSIDWENFPKARVLFFVDRDLSMFISEEIPISENIYITDMYSVENYVVSSKVLRIILDDFSDLGSLPNDIKDEICRSFSEQLRKFQLLMTDVMVWIIVWRRHGQKTKNYEGVCLNNIKLNKLIQVSADNCCYNPKFNSSLALCHIIHNWCKIHYIPDKEKVFKSVRREFRSNQGEQKFIRGKFLIWFMIKYLNSIFVSNETDGTVRKPKYSVTWGHPNLLSIIGNQLPIPESLRRFINNTCVRYAIRQK